MSIAIVSGLSDYVYSHVVYIPIYVALVLHIIAVMYTLYHSLSSHTIVKSAFIVTKQHKTFKVILLITIEIPSEIWGIKFQWTRNLIVNVIEKEDLSIFISFYFHHLFIEWFCAWLQIY